MSEIPPNDDQTNLPALTSDRARALGGRAREGWARLQGMGRRVGAQATQGAELARLKREQLRLARDVKRQQADVGRRVAATFASEGSPIVIEGELASQLGALADAEAALGAVEERIAEGRQALRSDATGPGKGAA